VTARAHDTDRLSTAAAALFSAGLAPGTRTMYGSVVRGFLAFCDDAKLPARLPAPPAAVCMWLAHLFVDKHLRPASLRTYLSALSSAHVDLGLDTPCDHATVTRTLKGIFREGAGSRTVPRFPVTSAVLEKLAAHTRGDPLLHVALVCAWIATTGLFRTGELVGAQPPTRARLTWVPAARDIANPTPPHALIELPRSKCDPFGAGVKVCVASSRALSLLRAYMDGRADSRTGNGAPLFLSPVTRTALSRTELLTSVRTLFTRAGINTAGCSGLSFRRGGATDLASRQVPAYHIQMMGRWASDAFYLYIHKDTAALARVAALL
jgi:hypothetical protein